MHDHRGSVGTNSVTSLVSVKTPSGTAVGFAPDVVPKLLECSRLQAAERSPLFGVWKLALELFRLRSR